MDDALMLQYRPCGPGPVTAPAAEEPPADIALLEFAETQQEPDRGVAIVDILDDYHASTRSSLKIDVM